MKATADLIAPFEEEKTQAQKLPAEESKEKFTVLVRRHNQTLLFEVWPTMLVSDLKLKISSN